MADPYAVLGVPPTASAAEITQAYRRQLRSHHPDSRSGESDPSADERLQQILAAYALLRDPGRRRDHDRAGIPVRDGDRAVPITVTRIDPDDDGPALWAGPVTWHG